MGSEIHLAVAAWPDKDLAGHAPVHEPNSSNRSVRPKSDKCRSSIALGDYLAAEFACERVRIPCHKPSKSKGAGWWSTGGACRFGGSGWCGWKKGAYCRQRQRGCDEGSSDLHCFLHGDQSRVCR